MVWIVHLTEELWYVLSIISNEYFANTKNTIPKRSRKHNTWVKPVLKPFIMKNQCSRHQTFRTRLQETRAVASGTRVHSRVSNRRFWWKKRKTLATIHCIINCLEAHVIHNSKCKQRRKIYITRINNFNTVFTNFTFSKAGPEA